jgi:hypothetical protein
MPTHFKARSYLSCFATLGKKKIIPYHYWSVRIEVDAMYEYQKMEFEPDGSSYLQYKVGLSVRRLNFKAPFFCPVFDQFLRKLVFVNTNYYGRRPVCARGIGVMVTQFHAT